MLITLALLAFVSCNKEKPGPTEVDYGEVYYALFTDDHPVSFEYLSCFKESEMDEDQFITYTDDRKGVLTYQVYDPTLDEQYETSVSYEKPNKRYKDIAAFTDEEAEEYVKVALGMISSQSAEYSVDDFSFERKDGYIRLSIEATAEYKSTGELQKLWMVKIITSDDHVYTLQAFAPASIVTKYGPAFKNVSFAE